MDRVLHSPTPLTSSNRPALLRAMTSVVKAACAEIMRVYQGTSVVGHKPDHSPLTEADLAAHDALVVGLGRLMPNWPVVSEEGRLPPYAERQRWPAYWLADPLDGTQEFLAESGEFTVNLALIEHGRPTLGVVGVPARGQFFVGDVKQRMAQRIGAGGTRLLRARAHSGRSPIVVASRRHGDDHFDAALKAIEQHYGSVSLRRAGSALKLCALAEGEADLYPRLAPTSEWDTAAGQAILEAAGGAVLQLSGTALAYSKPSVLNPPFVAMADPKVDWVRFFGATPR